MIFLLCSTAKSYAQSWQARHGLTSSQYQNAFNTYAGQGYRLVHVSGYSVNNQSRFAAIWEKKSGPAWVAKHGLTSSQYQSAFDTYAGQGYRLVLVNGYTVNNQARYVAIWEKKSGPAWVAKHGLTSSQYQNAFNTYAGQGYRLVHVSGYSVNNQSRFAAIWEKKSGPAWVAKHGLTSSQYQSAFDTYTGQGYRLVLVNGYTINNQIRYVAIWEKKPGPAWVARHGMTGSEYQGEFSNFYYQGFRLKSVSGYSRLGKALYAAIWESQALSAGDLAKIESKMKSYMEANGVPGVSVAITKDERLIFARGFGYADQEKAVKVNPVHRFRIASVSKPITSVAIMRLIQKGKVNLEDTVFGSGGVLGTNFGTPPYQGQLGDITIQHLLEHTSGWAKANDPMFEGSGMTHAELIGYMLDNVPLAEDPGDKHSYLNFGYCVLGRVIEQLTGQSYEDYVQKEILAPIGIQGMEIAGDTKGERKQNEVVYYGGSPYSIPVARMDSHGGWIASPIDLTRLLVRVDGNSSKPDILNTANLTTMLTISAASTDYAKGWVIDSGFRWHNGAFRGTIAYVWIRNDGFTAAVVANTRPSSDGYAGILKGTVDKIIDEVTTWPTFDLF